MPGKLKNWRNRAKANSQRGATEKAHIQWVLVANKIPYEKEFYGLKPRKYRFDFALVERKIAIEYEGVYTEKKKPFTGKVTRENLAVVMKMENSKNKSRHTTVSGYTEDTRKYNLAVIRGWRVLRYTSANYKDFESDLLKLLIGF